MPARATRRPVAADPGPSILRGAGAPVATLLSLGIWYRRFDWTTGEDERHTARTPDGWNLALYRYRPKGDAQPLPVVCGHGMAGTRLIYDLHPNTSLARYLAFRGFDTWLQKSSSSRTFIACVLELEGQVQDLADAR